MQQTGSTLVLTTCLAACFLEPADLVAAEPDPIPEEIVVKGSRDDINLQLQVDRAEDEFYAILNDLVPDADFRIECKYEKVLGTLIKQRICQTGYMRKELSTAATLSLYGVDYMISASLTEKNRKLREITIELLEKNPELRNAALNLNQRVEEYRDEYGIADPGE